MSSVLKTFWETSAALKARTGKGRGDVEPPHEQLTAQAQSLVEELRRALEQDLEKNEQHEPGTARLASATKACEGRFLWFLSLSTNRLFSSQA
jgi:hypothetical protein